MTSHNELKECANRLIESSGHYNRNEQEEFLERATPEAVIDLIAENERNQRFVAEYAESFDQLKAESESLLSEIKYASQYSCFDCLDTGEIKSGLDGKSLGECLKCFARDAKRYRWLRETRDWEEASRKIDDHDLRQKAGIAWNGYEDTFNRSGADLDAAIDILMGLEEKE